MLITLLTVVWFLPASYYHASQMQGKPNGHFPTLLYSLSNVISVPFFPS
jgi:hypothetical protein